MYRTLAWHLQPFQTPHPPIGIAGLTPVSDTLKLCGERGFMPMSLNIHPSYAASHWASVVEGAERAGRTASRRDWKVVREVFVADTDEEARRGALDGMLARCYREYLLPLFGDFGFTPLFKHDESVPDSDVTPEYLVEHGWLVGSVDTVVDKLGRMYDDLGGFGTLLMFITDYSENPEPWRHSMELLAKQVLPKVNAQIGALAAD